MDDLTATVRALTIGDGTVYKFTRYPAAVLDTAPVRELDEPRPRDDGAIAGDDFTGARPIVFELETIGPAATVEQRISDLAAAFAPAASDLWIDVRIAGSPSEYSFRGRTRGISTVWANEAADVGIVYARCVFVATDPVRYAAVESSVTLDLAPSGAGLTYPVEYPIVYAGGGGSGSASAANAGSAAVHWQATLTGPLTNPRLVLDGSGKFVRLLATIAAGETVLLDSRSGSILLDGTTPRPSWFAPGSRWFRLEPGTNGLTFTADAGSGTAQVTWRSGWA